MALRTFRDGEGRAWRVCEVSLRQLGRVPGPRRVLPGLAGGWLCFEAGGDKRRLAPYPADWHELDDRALALLCAAAWPAVTLARPTRAARGERGTARYSSGGGRAPRAERRACGCEAPACDPAAPAETD
jgi:hypothetical protein